MSDENERDQTALGAWISWVLAENHDVRNLTEATNVGLYRLTHKLKGTEYEGCANEVLQSLAMLRQRLDAYSENAHAFARRGGGDHQRIIDWSLERAARFGMTLDMSRSRPVGPGGALVLLLVLDLVRQCYRPGRQISVELDCANEGASVCADVHISGLTPAEIVSLAEARLGPDARVLPNIMGAWTRLHYAAMTDLRLEVSSPDGQRLRLVALR